jgi:hypothetical protein
MLTMTTNSLGTTRKNPLAVVAAAAAAPTMTPNPLARYWVQSARIRQTESKQWKTGDRNAGAAVGCRWDK